MKENNYIIEKYKNYQISEIQSGYRCKTYLLNDNVTKYIYQVYLGDIKYQAKKKKYVTELITKNLCVEEIPKVIEYGENEKFAYLVSEYKCGIEVDEVKKEDINFKNLYTSLAKILFNIHSINIGEEFGWIGENGLEKKKLFYEYIEKEIKRNIQRIKKIIMYDDIILNEITQKATDAISELKKISPVVPVISWYDINANNILIDENSSITGFLDAGGARFAAKEWDIAFIKMDLCNNKKEFNLFLDNYKGKINNKLLNILTVIVEIDDIAFQLETKIKLPIAFESNFKNIITKLQKEYM